MRTILFWIVGTFVLLLMILLLAKLAELMGYQKGFIDGYKTQQQNQFKILLNGQERTIRTNNYHNGNKTDTTQEGL